MPEVSPQQSPSHSSSDEEFSEAFGLNAQNEPSATESEESASETNYYVEMLLNGIIAVRRRLVSLTDEEEFSSSGDEDEVQETPSESLVTTNEDEFDALSAGKICLYLVGVLSTILHVFFAAISIVIGYINIGECPGNCIMPYVVLLMGPMRLYMVAMNLFGNGGNSVNNQDNEQTMLYKGSEEFIVLWFCEMFLFWLRDVSFDSSAANYCNVWLYQFTFVWNMFLILSFTLGTATFWIERILNMPSPNYDDLDQGGMDFFTGF